jgi:hypothetical protein
MRTMATVLLLLVGLPTLSRVEEQRPSLAVLDLVANGASKESWPAPLPGGLLASLAVDF